MKTSRASLLLVIPIGALALIASACVDHPVGPPSQNEPEYQVGQTANTGVFDVTVLDVEDWWESTEQFETPRTGNRFVAVEISLKNIDGGAVETWSRSLAHLTDGQGKVWVDVSLAGTKLPELEGYVGRGDTRQGWVVFEIDADASGLRMQIKGNSTAHGSLFDLGV